jgi:hypothetical protein
MPVIAQLPSSHLGTRPGLNLSGIGSQGFHSTYRLEQCHRAASAPILEPSRVRGIEWADAESGG